MVKRDRSDARSLAVGDPLARQLKTSERIARAIVRAIVEADLPEGTPLPVEVSLAQQYSVGRATVREALRLLESRGAISIRSGSGGGPAVRRPRPSDLADSLELILQFERSNLKDVLAARVAIESMAMTLAAERVTAADLEAMQSTVEQIRAYTESQTVFLEANAKFHQLAVDASGSTVLRYFGGSLKHLADGAAAGITYDKKRRLAVADAHEQVIDALAAHDADRAEVTMRRHLDEAADYWTRHYADLVSQPIEWW